MKRRSFFLMLSSFALNSCGNTGSDRQSATSTALSAQLAITQATATAFANQQRQAVAGQPTQVAILPVTAVPSATAIVPILTPTPTPTFAPTATTVLPTATATLIPPTRTPAPTATPAPQVLYNADWSDGLSGWPSGAWQVISKMLINDGSDGTRFNFAPAPFQPGNRINYAIEAEIQVVRRSGSGFGFVVRENNHKGYWVGVQTSSNQCEIYTGDGLLIAVGIDMNDDTMTKYNLYRAEIKDNSLRLLINGSQGVQTQDNKYLSPGRIGLWCSGNQINVRSFKIIDL